MDRKEVIKITLDLIREKKLEKTSIGEIVKRLNSSPGNLYYHFKNKNDIYKEVLDYSTEEILKNLDRVKTEKNNRNYLFNLTRTLIKFLEEREEILFFLISMKGTCYLDEEVRAEDCLINFRKALLNKKGEGHVNLKLRMFLGSIYEVLYVNRLLHKKYLDEEEIEDIYMSFWGTRTGRNRVIYEQDDLKLGLS
jgi:AcrR family transcriptional regulator